MHAIEDRGQPALVLRTHMLMSGSWHIYRVGEPWQRSPASARIVVGTATFVAVGFSVPIAEFVRADALERDGAIARLGPDVLSPDFDEAAAVARLATSTRPTVAEALLQQQAVAGIGNVYKSELLFLAGVHPFAAPADVSHAQWARLMHDARVLLRANVVDPGRDGCRLVSRHATHDGAIESRAAAVRVRPAGCVRAGAAAPRSACAITANTTDRRTGARRASPSRPDG